MKKTTYTLIAVIGVMLPLISANMAKEKGLMKNLSGYIEIVSNWGIQRIFLPSGKQEKIFKEHVNYPVAAFDVSPDGKDRVLEVAQRLNEPDRIVMCSSDKKKKTIVSRNFVRNPSFSPDGRTIAYLFSEYNPERETWSEYWYLYTVRTDGSMDKRTSNILVDRYKPSWFPDGQRLAVSTKDLEIIIIDIATGEGEKIIDFGKAPAVSHDGKKIAYLSNDVDDSIKKKLMDYRNISKKEYENIMAEKGERLKESVALGQYIIKHSIYIYDMDTRESKKLTEIVWVEEPPAWSPDDKYLIYNDRRMVSDDIYVLDVGTGEKEKIPSVVGRVMVWRK